LETQTIQFDDSYAHYAQAGEGGATVVVLHGWAASLKQWDWLLPILANSGHTAYALDLLGHGQAPRLSDGHAIQDYVDHLSRWMRALHIRQPVLLGHSMGGYLSLRYVLDHPGAARGLILVDPLYSYHQFYGYHQFAWQLLSGLEVLTLGEFFFRHTPRWLIEAGHYWRRDIADAPATLRRQVALDYKRADPRIVQTLPTIGDLRPYLGQVRVPALVTWGCRDQLLTPHSFESLVDLLPMAQGHCFTDMGHSPHLARPQGFVELTLDFLSRPEDRSTSNRSMYLWTSTATTTPTDR
jgi:pimeloyl-ACP methyl ester carboxylesterase